MKLSSHMPETGHRWYNTAGSWANETVVWLDHAHLEQFRLSVERRTDEVIDPRKIVGAWHPNYHNITWRDFLKVGQRIELRITELEETPTYYDAPHTFKHHLDPWHLLEVGGHYFIDQGHHRSFIAKFRAHEDGRTSQQVPNLDRVVLNDHAIALAKRLESLLRNHQRFEVISVPHLDQSGPIIHYQTRFILFGFGGLSGQCFTPEEAIEITTNANRFLFRKERFFGALRRLVDR